MEAQTETATMMEITTQGKSAGVVFANLQRNMLNLRSRQGEKLGDKTVLRHTVERVLGCEGLDEVIVFCPVNQMQDVAGLMEGLPVVVAGIKDYCVCSERLSTRKWGLESWRGGIHEATCFDEICFTAESVAILHERGISSVMSVGAESVLFDAGLGDGLMKHYAKHGDEMRFTFSQAPPGLAGCVYRLDLLAEIVSQRACVGAILAYQPKAPAADYINSACTYRVANELCVTSGRFMADTQRQVEKLGQVMAGYAAMPREAVSAAVSTDDNVGKDALQVIAAMEEVNKKGDRLPRELEVELNTAYSVRLKDYPHAAVNDIRGVMTMECFEKIVRDCGEYDDICMTLGGIGEALAHEQVLEMVQAAHEGGIWGINIETDGMRLEGELLRGLLESQADTISVYLDADSAGLYEQVKGKDGYAKVVGNMVEYMQAWSDRQQRGPRLIAHLVKTRETMAEMETFYDRWVVAGGAAVICGYNDYAGQVADHSVMDMSPPKRWACNKLGRQMTILANGDVVMCPQDYEGKCVLGNVMEESLSELWRGKELEALREAHDAGAYHVNGLCEACKEWHR